MEWCQIIVVFVVAFVVTYCVVPISMQIAHKLGAIDYPNNRRLNKAPVPRCGGIALYAGLLSAVLVLFLGAHFLGWEFHDLYELDSVNSPALFIGITLMFAVGLIDDITQLTPPVKLTGQIIAAFVVVLSGVTIGGVRSLFGNDYIALGWLNYPLTMLYLIIFVNITNLIDGLDGLASGLVAIVACGLMYLVWMRGCSLLVFACIALIAVCLAFLRFNFFPASVFMGDSGSLLLGLALGIISVEGVVRTQGFVIMLVPLVIAGVPVIDTVSAIIRRLRGHQRVDRADLGHIHHRLIRAGLGQERSVAVLWLCSAVLAIVGCLMVGISGPRRWALFSVLVVVVFGVVWKFGLFKPVLQHHYENRGKCGPRVPRKHR